MPLDAKALVILGATLIDGEADRAGVLDKAVFIENGAVPFDCVGIRFRRAGPCRRHRR